MPTASRRARARSPAPGSVGSSRRAITFATRVRSRAPQLRRRHCTTTQTRQPTWTAIQPSAASESASVTRPTTSGLPSASDQSDERVHPLADVRPAEIGRIGHLAAARRRGAADPVGDEVQRYDGERVRVERGDQRDRQVDRAAESRAARQSSICSGPGIRPANIPTATPPDTESPVEVPQVRVVQDAARRQRLATTAWCRTRIARLAVGLRPRYLRKSFSRQSGNSKASINRRPRTVRFARSGNLPAHPRMRPANRRLRDSASGSPSSGGAAGLGVRCLLLVGPAFGCARRRGTGLAGAVRLARRAQDRAAVPLRPRECRLSASRGRRAAAKSRMADRLAPEFEGATSTLTGVVASLPQPFERGVRFELDVEDAVTADPGRSRSVRRDPPLLVQRPHAGGVPGSAAGPRRASAGGSRCGCSARTAPRIPTGSTTRRGCSSAAIGATGYVRPRGERDPPGGDGVPPGLRHRALARSASARSSRDALPDAPLRRRADRAGDRRPARDRVGRLADVHPHRRRPPDEHLGAARHDGRRASSRALALWALAAPSAPRRCAARAEGRGRGGVRHRARLYAARGLRGAGAADAVHDGRRRGRPMARSPQSSSRVLAAALAVVLLLDPWAVVVARVLALVRRGRR